MKTSFLYPFFLYHTLLLLLIANLLLPSFAIAVEIAPRISDREIIESLAELKQALKQMDKRFESIDKRFESIDKRFESIDKRFESIDKRFESIDQRFTELSNTINTQFTGLLGLIIALFGYIAWDRRTLMKPLQEEIRELDCKQTVFNQDIYHDLELNHKDGSRMTRLLEALKELSRNDPKLASVLRSFSL